MHAKDAQARMLADTVERVQAGLVAIGRARLEADATGRFPGLAQAAVDVGVDGDTAHLRALTARSGGVVESLNVVNASRSIRGKVALKMAGDGSVDGLLEAAVEEGVDGATPYPRPPRGGAGTASRRRSRSSTLRMRRAGRRSSRSSTRRARARHEGLDPRASRRTPRAGDVQAVFLHPHHPDSVQHGPPSPRATLAREEGWGGIKVIFFSRQPAHAHRAHAARALDGRPPTAAHGRMTGAPARSRADTMGAGR
jgi:hypothetical protein